MANIIIYEHTRIIINILPDN